MANSDAFALKNSGLNEFLFAEVGSEINGTPLTILSVLARLGKDPWAEAARLARLPKSSTIDDLANSISKMPLCPQALMDARGTAARLILLLPSQVQSVSIRASLPVGKSVVPAWIPVSAFLAILAFGIAFLMIPPATSISTAKPLVEQTIAHPQAATN
ncbi:hypothetical protein [Rhodopila sp.]|uniref:hypothetical protein n=1 Tax=Rhodopila sp. TaxID=2480087 RepID=UPI003D09AD2D